MKFSAVGAVALAGIVDLVAAQNNTTTTPTGTPTEACAVVSSAWAAQLDATATPTVEASIAYECLNSVPIDKDGALQFIDEMAPYIEWQSDTAFKKSPPKDYFYPGYDIWAVIAEVRAGIEAGEYASEYAWQVDLYKKLFGQGHDGHFVVYPDALSAAIEWARPYALISISEEGPAGSAPVIKVYEDVVSSPDTASVVTLINGVDAATYIQDWVVQVTSNQDVDAAYNSMFFTKAFAAELANLGYFQSGGRVRYVYPGEVTSFTFENGTSLEVSNLARLKGSWTGVVDGPSFFTKFCPGAASNAPLTSATTATATATAAAATATVEGYPEPVIISSDGIISGYFVDEPGFEDVAVIAMLSFSPDDPVEFQHVAQDFFAACVTAGKTKLVVDVQANGGGYIFSGYDLFRQLFPDFVQEGLGRWRDSDGFLAVSDVYSSNTADFDADTASVDTILMYESVYNWRYDLNITNEHFTSYEDKFGPVQHLGDNYTNLMQWDFNDPLNTINATFGFGTDITGYRSRANFTRPFGGPENIVLLLDGYCASTCTLFSQFAKEAGVQSIAMGGRPSKAGLIQGVGGVKGSQSYGYVDVKSAADLALAYTDDAALVEVLSNYTDYVVDRSTAASLNVKDEILRAHIDDGTPAQFVAEYSDCRLWWTVAIHESATALWKAAASAAFKGGDCAYGSIDYAANTTKKGLSRPGLFSKPRYTLLTKRLDSVQKREAVQKSPFFLANQYMKVVD
ncbi:Uu.00g119520.m01.CDS01 [Anthostomella pinea]|uniref:Uu.00g119520.m01.CDS01 n=1 Tax=Anthostomella pinea TaxID=933095 RepID=A0AAI8YEQ3_9PEZI|nr:Uu.00g119520.m01.CDS01 [Anthostomella pinea]